MAIKPIPPQNGATNCYGPFDVTVNPSNFIEKTEVLPTALDVSCHPVALDKPSGATNHPRDGRLFGHPPNAVPRRMQ